MLIWQILAVVIVLAFVVIALLALIEPGPLNRRSRDRHAPKGNDPSDPQDRG
jgi:hypothetical protein